MKLREVFGSNVAKYRKLLGWTQKDLADVLGISNDALSRMERGKMAPKLDRIPEIAKVLLCSIEELFRDDGRDVLDVRLANQLHDLPKEQYEKTVHALLVVLQAMKP